MASRHSFLLNRWRQSPLWVRVLPFALFVALTSCQGLLGEGSKYWIYAFKTFIGAILIYLVSPWVREMRWRWSWSALIIGVAVFVLWVGLDGLYPPIEVVAKNIVNPVARPLGLEQWCAATAEAAAPWNPHHHFAAPMAWFFVLARLVGSSLVVPPLEEVFYRSFLYRYVVKPEFTTVPLNYFRWGPLLLTSAIFGLAHREWLAGVLCGLLYQGLVLRSNRLGDAITAHAITNFLLGLWVMSKSAWHFW
ncbi:MAG: CAAX prenyl protease-related protein [Verrucomicrobiota bacterium]